MVGSVICNSEKNIGLFLIWLICQSLLLLPFQIKAKPWPKPRTDLPWGLAQAWFDNTNAKIVGITGAPIIKMIGEKRKELMIKTPDERILSVCHIYDAEGNELVQDKDRDVKYTVLLSRKNPIPSSRGGEEGEDESSLLPFITKDENPERTIFTISDPPKEGFYKVSSNF